MPLGITTKQIKRSAVQTIHHPPKAGDKVTVSHNFQKEKAKMVKELTPFLMYLYKKHMNAKIQEGTDLEMMKLINKAMRQMPGSPAQKKTLDQLNKLRKSAGMKPIGEDIKIPIKVGDTILGGKFKNKRIVVKSIGKNEKGDITINGKPLLKYRLLDENTLNEIPMGDLQKIDQFADKKLNPVDVVLTDKHFFDRLNDPRNGKEITSAELIGFFKRLSKHKKEFVDFLNKYNSVVAVDDRTNINIPFMKQANRAIAKTVMRKKDFKTPDQKLDI